MENMMPTEDTINSEVVAGTVAGLVEDIESRVATPLFASLPYARRPAHSVCASA